MLETPAGVDEAKVIVTFLPHEEQVDLEERGIDQAQAASLHARLAAFADDWGQPDMNVYDAP